MARRRDPRSGGNDSTADPTYMRSDRPYDYFALRLQYGYTMTPQTEGQYRNDMVGVTMIDGPVIPNPRVGWPGPNVGLNKSGIPGPGAQMIHGLYEGPLPGQKVLVGYPEGNHTDPVVLAKFPYPYDAFPSQTSNYTTPRTNAGFSSTDIVLGHFGGSYIALTGVLPFPMGLDINVESRMTMYARTGLDFETLADFKVDATTNVDIQAKGLANFQSTGVMTIKGGATVALTGGNGAPPAEPAVLGTKYSTMMTALYTALKGLTVTTPVGPGMISPASLAAVTSAESQLTGTLSTVFTHN